MSAHIDETYIENAIGASVQTALATGTALTQAINVASSIVDSALIRAGYAVPASSPPDLVKAATLGQVLPLLYAGRAGLRIPANLEPLIGFADLIGTGAMPVPGLSPNAAHSVGGVKFSSSDSTDSDGLPQVYKDLREVY